MAKAKKAKAKRAKSKKSKASKPSSARTKKPTKRSAASASRGGAKRAKKAAKPGRKTAKAVSRPKKQRRIGEGDYEASRSFLKDQSEFVKRHERDIPAMGQEAERAMEGPEGKGLRAAEEEARSHSKAMGQ